MLQNYSFFQQATRGHLVDLMALSQVITYSWAFPLAFGIESDTNGKLL